ncbi:MAG: CBS domain-containing protein [Andreesenia angusta]|nr:CBS domain-containing protein [Andreesenia angusta]
MLAKDIMTTDVISVHKDDKVEDAMKLLLEKDISGLPVVDDNNKLIGIITEGDLIYKSNNFHFPLYYSIFDSYIFLENPSIIEEQLEKMTGYKIEEVMTKTVYSAKADASINDISTLMTNKDVNRIPIVDDNDILIGIVARKDIIKSYIDSEK